MRIETNIHSEILALDTTVSVILPQEKQPYSGDGKLKVLWLLHGGSGDHTAWLRMSAAERYANEYGIALVTPGGLQSCFTDMEHGGRFHSYLTEELPPLLRHLFPRLSAAREDNYISGYSNGGYGCLKAGLARPDLYGAIGAFSAGDKSDVPFVNDGSLRSRDRIQLFGEGSLKGTDNDLQHLGRRALAGGFPLPRVYHACGSLDPWLDLNLIVRDFFDGLEGNPYDYRYHQPEGMAHTWDFWDLELLRFFDYLGLEKEPGRYVSGM
ncbi:alpha/beta hydrolase [Paenibacillus mucilaginosus]|uniref:Putative tributyrin esterase n=1 Tax=Paenibacillus mucilaginosus (strain KNP414) TaxID=1036673 RepID=F8FGK0_PAEMK|nr:alpha/beta hydrolase-fold protein [Paenibacillus mucilaginosus]AEI44660.1 putative tributyrin esterase [Paenibacillus mucilaginosus KNP414]MCG7215590.1 transcriptional antiterminator [Paenibacillus mucilaginosus]WDM26219.1 transcriptional antiterminator [Paenibacillus mucilaginosus]